MEDYDIDAPIKEAIRRNFGRQEPYEPPKPVEGRRTTLFDNLEPYLPRYMRSGTFRDNVAVGSSDTTTPTPNIPPSQHDVDPPIAECHSSGRPVARRMRTNMAGRMCGGTPATPEDMHCDDMVLPPHTSIAEHRSAAVLTPEPRTPGSQDTTSILAHCDDETGVATVFPPEPQSIGPRDTTSILVHCDDQTGVAAAFPPVHSVADPNPSDVNMPGHDQYPHHPPTNDPEGFDLDLEVKATIQRNFGRREPYQPPAPVVAPRHTFLDDIYQYVPWYLRPGVTDEQLAAAGLDRAMLGDSAPSVVTATSPDAGVAPSDISPPSSGAPPSDSTTATERKPSGDGPPATVNDVGAPTPRPTARNVNTPPDRFAKRPEPSPGLQHTTTDSNDQHVPWYLRPGVTDDQPMAAGLGRAGLQDLATQRSVQSDDPDSNGGTATGTSELRPIADGSDPTPNPSIAVISAIKSNPSGDGGPHSVHTCGAGDSRLTARGVNSIHQDKDTAPAPASIPADAIKQGPQQRAGAVSRPAYNRPYVIAGVVDRRSSIAKGEPGDFGALTPRNSEQSNSPPDATGIVNIGLPRPRDVPPLDNQELIPSAHAPDKQLRRGVTPPPPLHAEVTHHRDDSTIVNSTINPGLDDPTETDINSVYEKRLLALASVPSDAATALDFSCLQVVLTHRGRTDLHLQGAHRFVDEPRRTTHSNIFMSAKDRSPPPSAGDEGAPRATRVSRVAAEMGGNPLRVLGFLQKTTNKTYAKAVASEIRSAGFHKRWSQSTNRVSPSLQRRIVSLLHLVAGEQKDNLSRVAEICSAPALAVHVGCPFCFAHTACGVKIGDVNANEGYLYGVSKWDNGALRTLALRHNDEGHAQGGTTSQRSARLRRLNRNLRADGRAP